MEERKEQTCRRCGARFWPKQPKTLCATCAVSDLIAMLESIKDMAYKGLMAEY